jgi:hypothetical protein
MTVSTAPMTTSVLAGPGGDDFSLAREPRQTTAGGGAAPGCLSLARWRRGSSRPRWLYCHWIGARRGERRLGRRRRPLRPAGVRPRAASFTARPDRLDRQRSAHQHRADARGRGHPRRRDRRGTVARRDPRARQPTRHPRPARNQLGRTARAEADARQALELSPPESDAVRPLKVAQLADALIARGALREAERLLSATELARNDRDTILFQSLRLVHARLLDLRGRRQEALDELAAVGRWARAWGCANPGWIAWRAPAALVHRALGHHEEARLLAAEELKAAHSFGAPHCVGVALRVVGLVSDPPEIDSLRESVKALESTNARPELARSLVELGSALRRAGHPRDSQDPLQRAYALATDCGHALLADHTRRELLASGGRPPPAQPARPAPRTARGGQ